MRRTTFLCTYFMLCLAPLFGQVTYKYQHNKSFTYEEGLQAFEQLGQMYPQVELREVKGSNTDVGRPLHLAVFNANGLSLEEIGQSSKAVLLINNAIHPGESCGLDASVKLFEYLGIHHKEFENVIVCAIPVYNIGGMLNRGPYKRSGQPGPMECGFRGNYQHLDLNRDFIKLDSKNAQSFTTLFHTIDPDVFVDTHTTNGSDHQYTLTLITSQRDRLMPTMQTYVYGKLEPYLYRKMEAKGKPLVPYVYLHKKVPQQGIKAFLDIPRYSSGYASLFQTISFITEAHKYKPFEQRVEYTYAFLKELAYFTSRNAQEVIDVREKAREEGLLAQYHHFNWVLDTHNVDSLSFKGYDTLRRKSEVTDQLFLAYDRSKKRTFDIHYFQHYSARDSTAIPSAYVVPQAYPRVLENLSLNHVKYTVLECDTFVVVEVLYITDFETVIKPYEKHYLHSNIQLERRLDTVQFYRGDVLVPTDQLSRQYIVSVLEPQSEDSFFNWNYFDNILQQKEWFSSFAFDEVAHELLTSDPLLESRFKEKKSIDLTFAKSHKAQLQWIFEQSPYHEKEHNRYPIMRIR